MALLDEIYESIGYILCETSFKIHDHTQDWFDEELQVKPSLFYIKRFMVWFANKCYVYGCYFYGLGLY